MGIEQLLLQMMQGSRKGVQHEQIYEFSGIDYRWSELTRNQSKSSDSLNVYLDFKRRLRKRGGFKKLTSSPTVGFGATDPIQDIHVTPSGDILACSKYNFLVMDKVTKNWKEPFSYTGNYYVNGGVKLSFADYNKSTYFCTLDGKSDLIKYDGQAIYRAGLPKGQDTIDSLTQLRDSPTSGNNLPVYIRMTLNFRDPNGTFIQSDYFQQETTLNYAQNPANSGTPLLAADMSEIQCTMGSSLVNTGFNSGCLVVDREIIQTISTTGNLTINVLRHNLAIGSYLMYENLCLIVTAQTTTSVTFKSTDYFGEEFSSVQFGDGAYWLTGGAHYVNPANSLSEQCYSNVTMLIWMSKSKSLGYSLLWEEGIDSTSVPSTPVPWTFAFPLWNGGTNASYDAIYDNTYAATRMTDINDPNRVKGLPPSKPRFVSTHWNQLTVIGRDRVGVGEDSTSSYLLQNDAVFFSDLGVGGSVETFNPLDVFILGDSSEGSLNALASNTNCLHSLKEKNVYSVQGVLGETNPFPTSLVTGEIGCIAPKSILRVNGSTIFMTRKGMFELSPDGKFNEGSEPLHPLWIQRPDLDLSTTTSLNDILREKFYFWVDSKNTVKNIDGVATKDESLILVWDKRYDEWFIWKGISFAQGAVMFEDLLTFAYGGELYQITWDEYSDLDLPKTILGSPKYVKKPIESYYYSSWLSVKDAEKRKRFISLIVHSIGSEAWDCSVQSQMEYDETVTNTNEEISFSGKKHIGKHDFNQNLTYALRFRIGNDKLNQGILVDGVSFTYEAPQNQPRI